MVAVQGEIGNADDASTKWNSHVPFGGLVVNPSDSGIIVRVAERGEKQLECRWLVEDRRHIIQHDQSILILVDQIKKTDRCQVSACVGIADGESVEQVTDRERLSRSLPSIEV